MATQLKFCVAGKVFISKDIILETFKLFIAYLVKNDIENHLTMKTRVYLITALFFNAFFAVSQESTLETLNEKLNDIPYVFKGEMTKVQYYIGDSLGNRLPPGTYILENGKPGIAYSSATIKICQIFKGQEKLKPGTIELITSAPKYFKSYIYADEQGDTNIGYFYNHHGHNGYDDPLIRKPDKYNGIFFLKNAHYPGDSKFEFDNPFGVYVTEINSIGYLKWTDIRPDRRRRGKHMAGWHDRKADTTYVFYTETQVMQFLAQHTDLDTGAVNYCEHRKKEPEKKMYAPPPYPHEKRVKNHDEWMEYWLNMKDSIKKKKE